MKKETYIYAIKVSELLSSGLRILNVKIGQTSDIKSTLRQYKRSNPEVEVLGLWESNSEPFKCEKGVHKFAEKYAYQRERENFTFLQESYKDFAENLSLLLKEITDKDNKVLKNKKKRIKTQNSGYTNKKPILMKFNGKEYKVDTWREVLGKVVEEIYKEKKDLTPILAIKGKKRIYFSENRKNLVSPQKINGSPYFYEGNLSANHIMKIINILLNTFDYDSKDLEIFCK